MRFALLVAQNGLTKSQNRQKWQPCGIGTPKITQNHSQVENTWNWHPKITQTHKSASKMAAKCTQNHSKIDPKSLKINAISENAEIILARACCSESVWSRSKMEPKVKQRGCKSTSNFESQKSIPK